MLICIPTCGKEADACMGVQELVYEIEVQEELLCIEYKKSTHQIVAGTESNKVHLGVVLLITNTWLPLDRYWCFLFLRK